MQPRFPNLQAYESPPVILCVFTSKRNNLLLQKPEKNSNYNFTTLRGRGKDSHTVYHKSTKGEASRAEPKKRKKGKNQ